LEVVLKATIWAIEAVIGALRALDEATKISFATVYASLVLRWVYPACLSSGIASSKASFSVSFLDLLILFFT